MNPFLAAVVDFWWIVPLAAAAGAVGWFGVRARRARAERRLGLEAARLQLHRAHVAAATARSGARIARLDLDRVQAEAGTGRAGDIDIRSARARVTAADDDRRRARADVSAARAQAKAARAAVPADFSDPTALPLPRLMAVHDAVTARWLDYETDPTKQIAFPAMSDAHDPLTAAYHRARADAQSLRPATPRTRITPAEFGEYQKAVWQLRSAFDVAEAHTWQLARENGTVPPEAATPTGDRPPADRPWDGAVRAAAVLSAGAVARAARGVHRISDAFAEGRHGDGPTT